MIQLLFIILTLSILFCIVIYLLFFTIKKKEKPKPVNYVKLPKQLLTVQSTTQIPTTQSTTTPKPIIIPTTQPIIKIPIPDSFTSKMQEQMKAQREFVVPLYVHVVKELDYNVNNVEYNSHVTSAFFNNYIVPKLINIYGKYHMFFNMYQFEEVDGYNNISTLLYDDNLTKASTSRVENQIKLIYNFLNNPKNTNNLNSPKNNNERILSKFMLSSMINETIIENVYGIDIYFVPFLWGSINVVTIDRNELDIDSILSNQGTQQKSSLTPTKPTKPIILVAQYSMDPNTKEVTPNLIKDSPNLNKLISDLALNIGFLFGMTQYEFEHIDQLSSRNIQFIRYNTFNHLINGHNITLLKKHFSSPHLLTSTPNTTKYQDYTNISITQKHSLIDPNSRICYENLELIKKNIENYNITEFYRHPIKVSTTKVINTDYYDTLDYSFF